MKPKIGAVILNYRTWENTCELAETFSKMGCIDKIVIIDNDSPDNSADKIEFFLSKKHINKAIFFKSFDNVGYARGNNIGLKYLVEKERCDFCIVSNPDTIVDEKCVNNLIDTIISNNSFAILTTTRRYSDGSKTSQYWDLPNINTILLERSYFYRRLSKMNYHYSVDYSKKINEIGAAPGSFFVIRSSVLKQVDYLDEETFLYFEENCLSQKIHKIGYKIGIITDSEYLIKKGEASTIAVKRTGAGMKHYIHSETHYVKSYLKPNILILSIYRLLNILMMFQGKFKATFLNLITGKATQK